MFKIEAASPLTRARLRINAAVSSLARGLAGLEQYQVVVCGFPRSGTSLLYNMLSTSLRGFRCEPFEQYFIYRIHRLGNYATKAPMDVLHVPRIDQLNINGKKLAVLVVVRDLRDVITSRHPVLPGQYFIGHDHSWWPQDKQFQTWSYDAPGVIEIFQAIQAISDRPDVMIIRYEELVGGPDAVQQRIAERYALSFDRAFSDYHLHPEKQAYKYEGRHSPVDATLVREGLASTKDRVSRWRLNPQDTQRIVEQFSNCEVLFDILEKLEYERDQTWFERLTKG